TPCAVAGIAMPVHNAKATDSHAAASRTRAEPTRAPTDRCIFIIMMLCLQTGGDYTRAIADAQFGMV
ncbi:hypothetical protein ABTE09_20170, partial [Acinetobacter baumannii]